MPFLKKSNTIAVKCRTAHATFLKQKKAQLTQILRNLRKHWSFIDKLTIVHRNLQQMIGFNRISEENTSSS